MVNKAETAKFEKRANGPDCATSAVERGDPSKGLALLLNKFTPGCIIRWQIVTVTSGTLRLEMRGEKP
ncbi:MAG TPA: hypothetical protein VKE24_13630, partial [Candidatus Acidoferrales bacterium]|nr:hypothetical protein [Candidatus Acidoferrales bacterium]